MATTRRTGAQEARLAALETRQAWAKWLAEITAHLNTLDDDELALRPRQYQCTSGRFQMGKGADLGGEGLDPNWSSSIAGKKFCKIYIQPVTLFYYGYGLVALHLSL